MVTVIYGLVKGTFCLGELSPFDKKLSALLGEQEEFLVTAQPLAFHETNRDTIAMQRLAESDILTLLGLDNKSCLEFCQNNYKPDDDINV